MEKRYYVNELGLISLVQDISESIISHTSGEIEMIEDPEDSSKRIPKNPNNFTTVKAVTDYLKDRSNLTVKYDSTSSITSNSYTIQEHTKSYNGEKDVLIDMKLVTSDDIKKLFN